MIFQTGSKAQKAMYHSNEDLKKSVLFVIQAFRRPQLAANSSDARMSTAYKAENFERNKRM